MGTPQAPLTADDLRGVPTEDEQRLHDWLAHVPQAIAWLQTQSGLTLDHTPDSLRPLWAWAITELAQTNQPTTPPDVPSWTRWRPYSHRTETMPPHQLWLWGAVAAYFGEVFRARAAAPPVEWQILRHPTRSGSDDGELALLRPAHAKRGKPRTWFCPLVIIGNTIGAQTAEHDPHHPRVGYNDPNRLHELLFLRLQLFGEVVPELATPEPEPEPDLKGSLLEMLEAPAVAAARAACPQRWIGLPEGLDEEDFTYTTEEICADVSFGGEDGEWGIFLRDSIRHTVLDDAPTDQDALLQTLLAHPLVTWAEHTDREVYEWATTRNPTREDMAALALTALAAAQKAALHRAEQSRPH
ncbi:hypothetical protein LWF15_33520 [Kineosporia rhizophila]|uniref:hypothetical protein n=1 Tax=Kineosporia rhizophila TaxID=84633 RepID=UPI001E537257|nr:hypothetical protein [Kineosporia rhizophila]MCE0540425.1 hypothetical protein [Kineosporia rhizophila]